VRWFLISLFVLGVKAQDLTDQIRAAQSAGNYAAAAELYLQLIAAGTDTAEVRSNCGVMFHLAGKNREAMEQLRAALDRNQSLAGANLFAGLTELDLGEPKLALPYLKQARESDPTRPAPLLALGRAYVALREYALANENYSKAATLDGSLAEAWYGVGVTDRSLAEDLLNRAARSGQNIESNRARVQELLDHALKALTRAVELDPNSARTHLIMAEALSDSGKPTEASTEYRTAMKLDPHLEAAYLGLASQYWKRRQFDDALPLLKHVLAKSPRDPEANGMMADILEHSGDNANAERYAEIALAGNPDLIQTHVVLARIYVARNESKRAIAELQKVISADPDGSYHFLLYRAYRQVGDEQAAKIALAEFQQLRHGGAAQ
jgi:tetratricopeptide (TPR) repeat protein